MSREEKNVGGKLRGCMQKRNKQGRKFEGLCVKRRWIGEESSER
jgi:hypothetical protein